MSDREAKRRADLQARLSAELVDAIERCWRTKFGKPAVVIEPTLAALRRGNE